MFTTEFFITLGILLIGSGLVGWMAWLEKHPRQSLEPRLLPTTLFIVIGGLAAILALFHLVDLVKPVVGG
jgi:hypothetical protein